MAPRPSGSAGAPAAPRPAWPWRLLVAVLVLCIVTQGVATGVQRTVSRVHFHVAVTGPAHEAAPPQGSAPVDTGLAQQDDHTSPARQLLRHAELRGHGHGDGHADAHANAHANTHGHDHGHEHAPTAGHTLGVGKHHALVADTARTTPRLFVHTRDLEQPRPANRSLPTRPHEHETRTAHAELAQHDHAAQTMGVVYVADAVLSGSSPTRAASLSRGLNDLDSLTPAVPARVGSATGQSWPDGPGHVRPNHIAAVPWRPPSV